MRSTLLLKPGPAGWVMATLEGGDATCYVAFKRSPDKRWQATWALIPAAHGDTLPSPRRVELAVNADPALADRLWERHEEPIGQIGTAPFFAAFTGYQISEEKPIRLERPAGKRLDKTWYAAVADAYRTAAARGLNPRAAIAEAAGVSPDVAGRWIYQARKTHKLLPPTPPGKVTV